MSLTTTPGQTAVVPLPPGSSPIFGAIAQANADKREELMINMESSGGWPPATILNLTPFPMRIEHGLIQYIIPKRETGKDFAAREITTARTFAQYRATHETSQGVGTRDYDIKAISPVEQAMEFYHVYSTGADSERAMGGIVVYEGTLDQLRDPNARVRQPFVQARGKFKVIRFREELLSVLLREATEQLKIKTMEMIQTGQSLFDDPDRRKNLTDEHRTYGNFAFEQRWIQSIPVYCSARTTEAKLCDGCGDEYRSKTGLCKCGFAQEPLKAYQNSVISYSHVRMDSLSADEWEIANQLKAERSKSRGSKGKAE